MCIQVQRFEINVKSIPSKFAIIGIGTPVRKKYNNINISHTNKCLEIIHKVNRVVHGSV